VPGHRDIDLEEDRQRPRLLVVRRGQSDLGGVVVVKFLAWAIVWAVILLGIGCIVAPFTHSVWLGFAGYLVGGVASAILLNVMVARKLNIWITGYAFFGLGSWIGFLLLVAAWVVEVMPGGDDGAEPIDVSDRVVK
jgi:cytochrome c oxidase subunit IV